MACCFFLDTAHNVLEYLEVIWHALRVSARHPPATVAKAYAQCAPASGAAGAF